MGLSVTKCMYWYVGGVMPDVICKEIIILLWSFITSL